MKQITYTEQQKFILKIIDYFRDALIYEQKDAFNEAVGKIYHDYNIPTLYMTVRDFIMSHSSGAYIAFHIQVGDNEIIVYGVGDFLCPDNLKYVYLLDNYYVVDYKAKSYGNNCENYHADMYLEIEKKED